MSIDLAGDVALQYADDFGLGAPFFDPTLEVGRGLGVMGNADHGDAPQGAVGLTITAAIESMTRYLPQTTPAATTRRTDGPRRLLNGVIQGCRRRPPRGRRRCRAQRRRVRVG